MEYRFADRIGLVDTKAVSELLRLASDPSIISFAGGIPASELFPVEELAEISADTLRSEGCAVLQYHSTEGYLPLRKAILENVIDFDASADETTILTGSQQGLDFVSKLFLNKGDAVLCEAPTFLGALATFKTYEAEIIGVETDEHGMRMDDVELALKNNRHIKMIYVIPDFQNPSGRTWSIERRKDLIRLSERYCVPIVEDNPYRDLRFEGERVSSIRALDASGNVIYLGSFSKTLCPGVRVGWACAPREIIEKFNSLKTSTTLHTNGLAQRQVERFLREKDYQGHVAKLNMIYKKRRDLMHSCLKTCFPESVSYSVPEGGMYFWLALPEGVDGAVLAKKAIESKVAFIAGEPFYGSDPRKNTMRLNYSGMSEERIEEGMARLGAVLHKNLSK